MSAMISGADREENAERLTRSLAKSIRRGNVSGVQYASDDAIQDARAYARERGWIDPNDKQTETTVDKAKTVTGPRNEVSATTTVEPSGQVEKDSQSGMNGLIIALIAAAVLWVLS